MKSIKNNNIAVILTLALTASGLSYGQGISINESGNPPDPSAILEVQPDVNFNKGLLLPRLTTTQRNSIASPVEGLIIYNTTTQCFEIYNGTIWFSVGCQCSGAPSATTASAASGITGGSFTANWGAVIDATTFYIDVATDAGFTSIVAGYNNLNVGNVTSFIVTGLNCNTNYFYRLRAANPCGTSAASNTISVTTLSTAPSAPTASAASGITGSSFEANWSNTGGTSYFLDVATDVGFTAFVTGFNNLDVGNVLTYEVAGLGCNSIYYFRVRAQNSCGTSGNSNTITVTTNTSAPSATTATAATAVTGGTFDANWNSSASSTAYFLDVATDAGFTTFVSGFNNLNVGNVLSYTVTGLGCSTTYYYRVRASNGCGTSTSSNTVTQATSSAVPSAPTASSATNIGSSSFSANWSAVGSATKYFLDVATDAGFTSLVTGFNDLDVGNVTTFSVTGLSCDVYFYRVRAFNPCGTSSNSNSISADVCSAFASWLYKVPVTITNGGSGLMDYQVQITIDTQALISGGKMQSNGEDIRVALSDCTEIPFWIETGTINTTTTQIWANVSSVPSGNSTIYVYYGNGAATSSSNGGTTFEFFDDFSSFDAGTWTATGTSSVGSGELTVNTGSVYTNSTVASHPGFISEAKVRWTGALSSYSGLHVADVQGTLGSNSGSDALVYLMTNPGSLSIRAWAGDGTVASYNIAGGLAQFTATLGTSYIIGQAVTSTDVIYYNNRTVTNSYTGTWTAAYYIWLGYFTGNNSGTTNITDINVDWVLVRKHAATVPSTSVGAEEAGCT